MHIVKMCREGWALGISGWQLHEDFPSAKSIRGEAVDPNRTIRERLVAAEV